MDELIESLKQLGFNSYEAKVYIALLKKYPATGYEVAKLADIPQSRAYDTLKSLENEKIIVMSNIEFLEKKLPDVKAGYSEPIHTISGSFEIRNKLIEIVNSAKKNIYIEIWSQDFKFLEHSLFEAYNRGLDIKIVGYDNFQCPFGTVYKHRNGREIELSLDGRLIFLITDDTEGIFGKVENRVVWTENPEIIFLLKEFVVHDMYLLDIEENFPEQLKYFYGAGLKKLKDKITNKNYSMH